MPIRRTNPAPQPVHWSKDYVEHLRTVHFALIATAIALVVIAITTKPYSTAVAARQIRQVQDLRKHWSPEFVREQLAHDEHAPTTDPSDPAQQLFEIPPAARTVFLVAWRQNPRVREINPKVYIVHLPDENWIEECPSSARDFSLSLRDIPPDTVSGFRNWWDKLPAYCLIYFPRRAKFGNIASPSNGYHAVVNILRSNQVPNVGKLASRIEGEFSLGYDEHKKDLWYFTFYDYIFDPKIPTALVMEIPDFTATKVDIKSLSAYMGLKEGTFSESFRDLEEVSKVNGIESLAALQETLSSVEPSDTPVFEAFGIKFPTDLATIGGAVVLLSVQLYFFVYLRNLYGTLKEDDPGWEVPWIGMDSSGLAKAMFLVTVALFPVLSVIALGGKAALRFTRGYWKISNGVLHVAPIIGWHWTVDLKLLALAGAVIVATLLGIVSWKYRPQLAAIAVPTEPVADEYDPGGADHAEMRDDPNGNQERDEG